MDNRQDRFAVKDHSITGEVFTLVSVEGGQLLKTTPQPSELDKYYKSDDYISHTDSARNLFEKAYQSVKKISLWQKIKLLGFHCPQKGNLLDIGCGTGDFLLAAQRSGWNTSGTEPNQAARKIAVGKGISASESTQSFNPANFEVITMWHVLEHVPDPDSQMADITKLLQKNGIAIIAVPNFRSHDATFYGEFWAAYDVPRHLWHFSREAISSLAARHGMEVISIKPLWFDAFYVSLLSEKHKSGRIRPVQGFWRGMMSNLWALRTGEFSSLIYVMRRK